MSASACLICGRWQHSPVGNPRSLFMTASAVLTAVYWDLPPLFSWWGNNSSTPSTIAAKQNGFSVTLLSTCSFHAEVLHGLIYFPSQSLQTFISLLWYLLVIWVWWRNKAVIFCRTLAICFPFTPFSSCLISRWPLFSYSLPVRGGFTVT